MINSSTAKEVRTTSSACIHTDHTYNQTRSVGTGLFGVALAQLVACRCALSLIVPCAEIGKVPCAADPRLLDGNSEYDMSARQLAANHITEQRCS